MRLWQAFVRGGKRCHAGLALLASKDSTMFVRQNRRSAPARRPKSRKSGAKSRKSGTKARGAKRAPARRRPRLGPVEQRHLDVIGLTLVALGAYLTFVLYMGWDGGNVGSSADDALSFLLGKVAYAIPLTLFVSGAALILKPFLPAVKPLRTGGICILAGLLLAFAAQTAGLGPDQPR